MNNIFDTRLPSVMRHDFSRVPQADIQRSVFKRPHGYKTAFNAGYLIPIYVDEALPGDTFTLNMSAVARLATPLVPIMDNIYMDFHFFAVPNRLVWSHWVNFMGEKATPSDSTEYLVPTMDFTALGVQPETLGDYMGLPIISTGSTQKISALPFRAYNLIWNEWFRDQNLQTPVTVNIGDGPDPITNYTLKKRGKRHDYFTSCLPWPQKGQEVEMPLGTLAPVYGNGKTLGLTTTGTSKYGLYWNSASGLSMATANYDQNVGSGTASATILPSNLSRIGVIPAGAGESGLYADLSSATAAPINLIREAVQLQRMLERDARGGTRYIEIIKSHFGVNSPDARLQRPEYIGGGTLPVNISSIPQTSETDAGTPQGHMAAYGYVAGGHIGFSKSFTEHTILIGLVSVRADLNYQQGINRMWSRQTRYDYYWPALAHLGEQEVLSKEIFYGNSADDENVFGYQERWAEYRYKPSLVTGMLRSTHSTPLDLWHLAQHFSSRPTLNCTFIEENPPISRIVAVTSEPQFIFDSYFDLTCARPMPMYSVPGMIDHF